MSNHENRPPIEPNRIYSRLEVAEVLNVSLSTVKRLIGSGQIRASKAVGMRRLFITGRSILEFLEETVIDPATYVDEEDDDE